MIICSTDLWMFFSLLSSSIMLMQSSMTHESCRGYFPFFLFICYLLLVTFFTSYLSNTHTERRRRREGRGEHLTNRNSTDNDRLEDEEEEEKEDLSYIHSSLVNDSRSIRKTRERKSRSVAKANHQRPKEKHTHNRWSMYKKEEAEDIRHKRTERDSFGIQSKRKRSWRWEKIAFSLDHWRSWIDCINGEESIVWTVATNES